MHSLTFLADIGLALDDPGMERVVRPILSHLSPEGNIEVGINIPVLAAKKTHARMPPF